jgi:hypothetical protein
MYLHNIMYIKLRKTAFLWSYFISTDNIRTHDLIKILLKAFINLKYVHYVLDHAF